MKDFNWYMKIRMLSTMHVNLMYICIHMNFFFLIQINNKYFMLFSLLKSIYAICIITHILLQTYI